MLVGQSISLIGDGADEILHRINDGNRHRNIRRRDWIFAGVAITALIGAAIGTFTQVKSKLQPPSNEFKINDVCGTACLQLKQKNPRLRFEREAGQRLVFAV